jgi:hypothetical protein
VISGRLTPGKAGQAKLSKLKRPALHRETAGRELLPSEEEETGKDAMIATAAVLIAIVVAALASVIVGTNRIARDE